ncbi:MAG: DUF2867 domain-containing protein [Bacteroidota bacterium]
MTSYQDTYGRDLSDIKNAPIESYARAFFSAAPCWLVSLMRLRDQIAAVAGLKTSNAPSPADRKQFLEECKFHKGDRLGIFEVWENNAIQITLGQEDKHLDFRVIIGFKEMKDLNRIYIRTEVLIHNNLGKIYFFLIKPFHRFIAPVLLNRMIRKVQKV